jgi:hypothetical protein
MPMLDQTAGESKIGKPLPTSLPPVRQTAGLYTTTCYGEFAHKQMNKFPAADIYEKQTGELQDNLQTAKLLSAK